MPVVLLRLGDCLEWMLAGGVAVLASLFVLVFVARIIEIARAHRRRRLEGRYRSMVDALGDPLLADGALVALAQVPLGHRETIGRLLLSILRVTAGDMVDSLRAGASAMGMDRRWAKALRSRKWWHRAEGAAALGLLRDRQVTPLLIPLLDDPHEQVRAAAVTALGWVADPAAIAPLLARLVDETRHQRVRIVEALQHFGPEVARPLLAHAAAHTDAVPLAADVIGQLRLTSAVDQLIEWTSHADPAARTAAWRAIGTVGLDDRGFYYAIRALGDDSPDVRAMAARSLGRATRVDASSYLARCLDDEWTVAAQAATALRSLGSPGRLILEQARTRGGQAGDLAAQVLWEAGAHEAKGSNA